MVCRPHKKHQNFPAPSFNFNRSNPIKPNSQTPNQSWSSFPHFSSLLITSSQPRPPPRPHDPMTALERLPCASPRAALFGKYEIGKLLGCGAFAKVYHARDITTGRSVAVKVINKKKIVSTSLMSNITREISIMRRLRHQHIVKLFEVLATKSKIFFVMEFVKGGELFAKVAKGRFSEELSRKYFQQLIAAVGYCHSRGVYHRDLKPENLLIDENGDLKVTDFGLSAVTGQIQTDGLLHTLCGTPAYVAPEILAKNGYDGAKVDVWSCGIILFVLTTGFLPFNDPNLMVLYHKIYKGEYRCPKWMSSDLKRFIARLLDTNPETRITVDGITRDPWFKKGGFKAMTFYDEEECHSDVKPIVDDSIKRTTSLNAFDLISFSSGLDLSALFENDDRTCNPLASESGERLVVGDSSPKKVVEKVAEMMKEEEEEEVVRLKKRNESGVELEGQNGIFTIGLEVFQLTDNLVVVEVKSKGASDGLYDKFWKNKIRPELVGKLHVAGV